MSGEWDGLAVLEGMTSSNGTVQALEQRPAIAPPQARVQGMPTTIEACGGPEQGRSIGEENIIPQLRIAFRDPGHVKKAPWREREGCMVRGPDQTEGEQMR